MDTTYVIIFITILTSVLAWRNMEAYMKAMHAPYLVKHHREYSRLLSHMFVHSDYAHLAFNMITLYFFGPVVESYFEEVFGIIGRVAFLGLYILGGLTAALPSQIKHRDNDLYRSLGASGAVSAILFGAIVLRPTMAIYFVIPAWLFGIFYLYFEFKLSKRSADNIAHDAHFFGSIFGVLYVLFLVPDSGMLFLLQILQELGL